jgi:hypothetical protein
VKKIITISFILVSVLAKAQNFASVGARWVYNNHDASTHQNSPEAIVSILDTVVNGIACQAVIGDCACGTSTTNYMYEINRRVYWYNNALSSFTLLYNFNLDAGDTWNVLAQNTTADSLTLRVDSTGIDTINNHVRKVQYVSTVAVYGNAYIFEGPVVEGIGSEFCLYPQSASCDPPSSGLRCYQDSILGYYDRHLGSFCEEVFTDSGIGITEAQKNISIILSPNPFHSFAVLKIENPSAVAGIFTVTDVEGRLIREEKFSGSAIIVRKENLEEGIYFYSLLLDHGTASGKIIID